MNNEDRAARVIGVYVDPAIKEWAEKEAKKRKWTTSFFCQEILRVAMQNSSHKGAIECNADM